MNSAKTMMGSRSGAANSTTANPAMGNRRHATVVRIAIVAFTVLVVAWWLLLGTGGASSSVGGSNGGSLHHQAEFAVADGGRRHQHEEQQLIPMKQLQDSSSVGHMAMRSGDDTDAYQRALTNKLQASVCPNAPPPTSFDTLTSFSFWGQTMNTSSPCPTAGMNNQIAMLLGLMYCAAKRPVTADENSATGGMTAVVDRHVLSSFLGGDGNASTSSSLSSLLSSFLRGDGDTPTSSISSSPITLSLPSQFRFKDISCSPTGGKEGAKSFKVGSADYEYAWFRWSEVFDVHGEGAVAALRTYNKKAFTDARLTVGTVGGLNGAGGENNNHRASAVTARVCLRDQYTWSEHQWMKARSCATTVDHFYGTALYWDIRALLPLHRWYYALSEEFLRLESHSSSSASVVVAERKENDDDNPNQQVPHRATTTHSMATIRARTLAIHVRRGDYFNFCRNTAKSSGVKKFRIAPFMWMKNGGAKTEGAGVAEMMKGSYGEGGAGATSTQQQQPHYNAKFLNLTSATTLSSKFMDSCAPSDDKVIKIVEGILTDNWKQCAGEEDTKGSSSTTTNGGRRVECIDTLVVMTNSGEFYGKIRSHFDSLRAATLADGGRHAVKVISMRDWSPAKKSSSSSDEEGSSASSKTNNKMTDALQRVRWPTRRNASPTTLTSSSDGTKTKFATRLTTTELAMMDVALLSLADTVVLNRYSTFSQSAIDFRGIREGSLEGLRLYWW